MAQNVDRRVQSLVVLASLARVVDLLAGAILIMTPPSRLRTKLRRRSPWSVTRTISFAKSKGFGANMAQKMLTTRSKV